MECVSPLMRRHEGTVVPKNVTCSGGIASCNLDLVGVRKVSAARCREVELDLDRRPRVTKIAIEDRNERREVSGYLHQGGVDDVVSVRAVVWGGLCSADVSRRQRERRRGWNIESVIEG